MLSTMGISKARVLLVGGRAPSAVSDALQAAGAAEHTAAPTAGDALKSLRAEAWDAVVITDALGQEEARALVEGAERESPVLVLGRGYDARAVADVLRAGASDFLVSPVAADDLEVALRRLLDRRTEQPPPHPRCERPSFGASAAMKKVASQVERVAPATSTVLLRGETGTGKGVVARAIHEASGRGGAFIELNCAALPEHLLESELFGYEKGAFTGAVSRKPGRVELADDGTLFLDEIGDVSPATQVKLLRLLQDKTFERLGGVKTFRANVRVIAATHQRIEALIERGAFREDLFYRLNVVTIWLPPLRTRRDDIAELAGLFVARVARENGRDVRLTEDALAVLRKQRWPGNVRQLENFIERLVVLNPGDVIDASQVETELQDTAPFATHDGTGSILSSLSAEPQTMSAAVRDAEIEAIRRALRHTRGNRKLAARLLGVSRATLYNKLAEYEITP